MLAWVETGGNVHMTDRHAVGYNVAYLDTRQYYHLLRGGPWGGQLPPPVSQRHPERPEEHLLVSSRCPLTRSGP